MQVLQGAVDIRAALRCTTSPAFYDAIQGQGAKSLALSLPGDMIKLAVRQVRCMPFSETVPTLCHLVKQIII